MRYLKNYKNIEEYYNDSESLTGSVPFTSYVKTNFETGDEVIYGVKEKPQGGTASVMYIDDFPDDMDYSPYDTFEEYLESYVEAPEYKDGTNICVYTGEQIEYDGDTYYLWTYDDAEGNYDMFYCLTSTIDYSELYDMSMEEDLTNRICPIRAILTEDYNETVYVDLTPDNDSFVLVKVEKDEE